MFEVLRRVSGRSDDKYSEISDEKLESLMIARLAFLANLREEIEFLRDLIIIADSPDINRLIEARLDKPSYDLILTKNRQGSSQKY